VNICSTLIIDDSEADRYILKRLIKKTGISEHIYEKENGQDALDFLADYEVNFKANPEQFPPILIFLDINMPIMDGFEFLEEFEKLQKMHDYSGSVLIMFTSSEREDDKAKALAYGFVKGYLYKMPSSAEELKAEVEKLLA
jgi:CheY-like chemotaxis protein